MADHAVVGRGRFGAVPARWPGRNAGGGDPDARWTVRACGAQFRRAGPRSASPGHRVSQDPARAVTIKFTCSCGKHLRARDGLAERRVVCPRCGYLAGVPALKPANPEGTAPLT